MTYTFYFLSTKDNEAFFFSFYFNNEYHSIPNPTMLWLSVFMEETLLPELRLREA